MSNEHEELVNTDWHPTRFAKAKPEPLSTSVSSMFFVETEQAPLDQEAAQRLREHVDEKE